MEPPRTLWTDERLNDMRELVDKNDQRLDATQNMVAALDLQFIEFQRERRSEKEEHQRKRDHGWDLRLGLLLVFIGQVGVIVTTILSQHG